MVDHDNTKSHVGCRSGYDAHSGVGDGRSVAFAVEDEIERVPAESVMHLEEAIPYEENEEEPQSAYWSPFP